MRFDEFISEQHIDVLPVDRLPGFAVGVELPPEWEPIDSPNGLRVWVWASDPHRNFFCANAVLNFYRLEAVLDPASVFAMLCEQQQGSVPNCSEIVRDFAAATEGPGVAATVVLQIDHEVGTIDSATRSRIVVAERETLIAQLTVTALHDSTRDHAQFALSMVVDQAADSTAGGHSSGAPVNAPQGRRHEQ